MASENENSPRNDEKCTNACLENAPQLFEPQRERLLLESGAKRRLAAAGLWLRLRERAHAAHRVVPKETNEYIELNFPPNFEGLVLGFIDADFWKYSKYLSEAGSGSESS